MSCSQSEFERFIEESRPVADGWISHYFGKSISEHQKQKEDIKDALIAKFLEYWRDHRP